MSVTPTDAQWAAIKKAVEWYRGGSRTPQVFKLAGLAGTGKTTVAEIITQELRRWGCQKVIPAAYTGKAANRLRQKGNPDARTFHAGMYMPVEDKDTGETHFKLAIDAPFSEADLILGDEVSMINEEQGRDAEWFGKKILVMGDPGQLPPVTGEMYWDIRNPDVMLTEIHRQAQDSPIIRLAHIAREGKRLPLGEWTDPEGNVTRVVDHGVEAQRALYRPETQAICGKHTVRWGYTQRIRRLRGFEGPWPMKGELVLCCKNDRDSGVFNGSFGYMLEDAADYEKADGTISDDLISLDVAMEDLDRPLRDIPVHPYLFDQHFDKDVKRPRLRKGIFEFDWGYVITCHKAQGSEWDDVTVVDDGGAFREDQHKWRYTAITRASKSLTFLRR